eukprot:4371224-Pleurochrysis_carterae.AAC.1
MHGRYKRDGVGLPRRAHDVRKSGSLEFSWNTTASDDENAMRDTYESSPQFRGVARNFSRKSAHKIGGAVRDFSTKSAPHIRGAMRDFYEKSASRIGGAMRDS